MANTVLNRPRVVGYRPPISINNATVRRSVRWQRVENVGFLLTTFALYFFLWAPILLLVVFSFNDSRTVNEWRGFTMQWYNNIFNDVIGAEERFSTALMLNSLKNSILVGGISTLIATVLGSMLALSLARGRYWGKRLVDIALFLPIVIPEIAQGVSLATFFMVIFDYLDGLGMRATSGFGTIIIGHVAFNISYVTVVVRARLANIDPSLEEAAQDLGADGWRTFWYILFPQILPGIIAGALLAFTLSLDDFIITFFNAGVGTTTLPLFVYGLLKTNVTPEINALSTLILLASTLLVGVSLALQNRSAR